MTDDPYKTPSSPSHIDESDAETTPRRKRGFIIALSGTLPLICVSAADYAGIRTDRQTAAMIGIIGLLLTAVLFVVGTTLIVNDKGRSPVIGFALGLISPLGTVIAVLMPDGDK